MAASIFRGIQVLSGFASVDQNRTFQYKPLDTTRRQIRLYQIHTSSDGRITGKLKHFNIEDAPSFSAISYMWGPENPKHAIEVDGAFLMIRQNLYDFFNVHAQEHVGNYLWADQICIQQGSIKERNHQVQMMETIYRKAKRVLVWFGKVEEEEDALQLKWVLGINDVTTDDRAYEYLHDVNHKAALRRLCNNQYWGRLWIVQEIILAQKLRFYYGDFSFDRYVFDQSKQAETLFDYRTKEWEKEDPGWSWQAIMQLVEGSDCANLHDKIYGVQNLLPVQFRLPVDYAKDIPDLFFDAAVLYSQLVEIDAVYVRGMSQLTRAMDLLHHSITNPRVRFDLERALVKFRHSMKSSVSPKTTEFQRHELRSLFIKNNVLKDVADNVCHETVFLSIPNVE